VVAVPLKNTNRFKIQHSGGQHMLTYRAEPASDSAEALDALRSLG